MLVEIIQQCDAQGGPSEATRKALFPGQRYEVDAASIARLVEGEDYLVIEGDTEPEPEPEPEEEVYHAPPPKRRTRRSK